MATSASLRPHAGSFAATPAVPARRPLRHWVPVAFALTIMAFESQNVFGAVRTHALLTQLAGRAQMSAGELWRLNIMLRKLGHFCGYGILALCFYRGWFAEQFHREPRLRQRISWIAIYRRPALRAVLATLAIGCVDELHQLLLPSRTASFRDVLLDGSGAALFAAVACCVLLLRCLIGGSYRRWFTAFVHQPAPVARVA